MKYTIRAIKYFFHFAIITTIILIILVFIGAAEANINTMFRGGAADIWKIAAMFALIAAVYPKLGFTNHETTVTADWNQIRGEVIEYFKEKGYFLESESDGIVTFRHRNILNRMTRMSEDRITVTTGPGAMSLEGLRKDVLRLCAGLEHRFSSDLD